MKKTEIVEISKYVVAGLIVGFVAKAVVYTAVKAAESKAAAAKAPAAEPAEPTKPVVQWRLEQK